MPLSTPTDPLQQQRDPLAAVDIVKSDRVGVKPVEPAAILELCNT